MYLIYDPVTLDIITNATDEELKYYNDSSKYAALRLTTSQERLIRKNSINFVGITKDSRLYSRSAPQIERYILDKVREYSLNFNKTLKMLDNKSYFYQSQVPENEITIYHGLNSLKVVPYVSNNTEGDTLQYDFNPVDRNTVKLTFTQSGLYTVNLYLLESNEQAPVSLVLVSTGFITTENGDYFVSESTNTVIYNTNSFYFLRCIKDLNGEPGLVPVNTGFTLTAQDIQVGSYTVDKKLSLTEDVDCNFSFIQEVHGVDEKSATMFQSFNLDGLRNQNHKTGEFTLTFPAYVTSKDTYLDFSYVVNGYILLLFKVDDTQDSMEAVAAKSCLVNPSRIKITLQSPGTYRYIIIFDSYTAADGFTPLVTTIEDINVPAGKISYKNPFNTTSMVVSLFTPHGDYWTSSFLDYEITKDEISVIVEERTSLRLTLLNLSNNNEIIDVVPDEQISFDIVNLKTGEVINPSSDHLVPETRYKINLLSSHLFRDVKKKILCPDGVVKVIQDDGDNFIFSISPNQGMDGQVLSVIAELSKDDLLSRVQYYLAVPLVIVDKKITPEVYLSSGVIAPTGDIDYTDATGLVHDYFTGLLVSEYGTVPPGVVVAIKIMSSSLSKAITMGSSDLRKMTHPLGGEVWGIPSGTLPLDEFVALKERIRITYSITGGTLLGTNFIYAPVNIALSFNPASTARWNVTQQSNTIIAGQTARFLITGIAPASVTVSVLYSDPLNVMSIQYNNVTGEILAVFPAAGKYTIKTTVATGEVLETEVIVNSSYFIDFYGYSSSEYFGYTPVTYRTYYNKTGTLYNFAMPLEKFCIMVGMDDAGVRKMLTSAKSTSIFSGSPESFTSIDIKRGSGNLVQLYGNTNSGSSTKLCDVDCYWSFNLFDFYSTTSGLISSKSTVIQCYYGSDYTTNTTAADGQLTATLGSDLFIGNRATNVGDTLMTIQFNSPTVLSEISVKKLPYTATISVDKTNAPTRPVKTQSMETPASLVGQSTSVDLGTFYTWYHKYVEKYGYSGSWSSTTTLGRFYCSISDMTRLLGLNNEDLLWDGCSNKSGSYGTTGTVTKAGSNVKIMRKANDRSNLYVVWGDGTEDRIFNQRGYIACIKIYEYANSVGETGKALVGSISTYESEASIDFTTAHDTSMRSQFSTFVNTPNYNQDYMLYSRSIPSNKSVIIEWVALNNDSKFVVK